jgi:hypothetical protein
VSRPLSWSDQGYGSLPDGAACLEHLFTEPPESFESALLDHPQSAAALRRTRIEAFHNNNHGGHNDGDECGSG